MLDKQTLIQAISPTPSWANTPTRQVSFVMSVLAYGPVQDAEIVKAAKSCYDGSIAQLGKQKATPEQVVDYVLARAMVRGLEAAETISDEAWLPELSVEDEIELARQEGEQVYRAFQDKAHAAGYEVTDVGGMVFAYDAAVGVFYLDSDSGFRALTKRAVQALVNAYDDEDVTHVCRCGRCGGQFTAAKNEGTQACPHCPALSEVEQWELGQALLAVDRWFTALVKRSHRMQQTQAEQPAESCPLPQDGSPLTRWTYALRDRRERGEAWEQMELAKDHALREDWVEDDEPLPAA